MTKQKHTKAADAASKAEEFLPLEQMMSQGSAPNEGTAHAVDATNQIKDSGHQGTEDEGASLVPKLRFADFAVNSQQSYEPLARVLRQSFSGGTPASNIDAYWNGDIHWASTKDLTSNVLTATADFITELGLRNSSSKLAKAGSILVGMHIGVGKVAIANIDVAINQDLRALVPDFSRVDLWFLLYVLEANAIKLEAYGRGSTVKGITQEDLLQLPVPVLPLPEQQRIGALFKELDHNIELNRGLLEKLTQLKKSMLEQMFPREGESVPRLRFAGFTEPWRSVYLKDVVTSFDYGLNAPAKDYDFCTKYLRITDIDEDSRKFLTTDLKSPDVEAVKASNYLAQDGDLFFARTASVGRTYLYSKSDGRVVFAGYLIRGHVRQGLFSPDFVFYSTLTTQYERFVAATSARSVQPGINAAEYVAYKFSIPSLAEQQRIGAFFKALDQRIAQQRAKVEKLGQLKKALLEQMFV